MTGQRLLLLTAVCCTVFCGRVARADILTAEELDEFTVYQNCVEACDHDQPVALQDRCRVRCGQIDPNWEKNLVAPIDGDDLELASLEFYSNASDPLICYASNGAVLPIAVCEYEDCVAAHGAALCVDNDEDGLFYWQETALGTSDSESNDTCLVGMDCGSCA